MYESLHVQIKFTLFNFTGFVPREGFIGLRLCFQKIAASMTLDIGEDRILLETRSNVYLLDIFLPFNIVQEEVGAQFNRKTKVTKC